MGQPVPVFDERAVSGDAVRRASRTGAEELAQIKQALAQFAPNQVIWNIEDLSLTPPWGDNISGDITDLSNYFVTSEGNNFSRYFPLH